VTPTRRSADAALARLPAWARALVSWKLAKFLAVGAFSYFFAVAQMTVYTRGLGLTNKPAYAVTLVVLILVNFLINRYWIFVSTEESAVAQGLKYVTTVVAGRAADWCFFALIDTLLPMVPTPMAVFLAMALVLPAKFLAFKVLVFRDRLP
jgi:putative flippase GtrA